MLQKKYFYRQNCYAYLEGVKKEFMRYFEESLILVNFFK